MVFLLLIIKLADKLATITKHGKFLSLATYIHATDNYCDENHLYHMHALKTIYLAMTMLLLFMLL